MKLNKIQKIKNHYKLMPFVCRGWVTDTFEEYHLIGVTVYAHAGRLLTRNIKRVQERSDGKI